MTCTAPSVIMLTRARNCILGTAAYLLNQSALWQLGLYKNHTVVQFLTSSCLFSSPFGFFTLTLLCRSRLLGGGRVLCPVLDHPDRQCLKVEKKERKERMLWDEFIDLNTGAITQVAEMADRLYRPHGQIHNCGYFTVRTSDQSV